MTGAPAYQKLAHRRQLSVGSLDASGDFSAGCSALKRREFDEDHRVDVLRLLTIGPQDDKMQKAAKKREAWVCKEGHLAAARRKGNLDHPQRSSTTVDRSECVEIGYACP